MNNEEGLCRSVLTLSIANCELSIFCVYFPQHLPRLARDRGIHALGLQQDGVALA